MKTVNLNALKIFKDGQEVDVMGVSEANNAELLVDETLTEELQLFAFDPGTQEYKALYFYIQPINVISTGAVHVGIGLIHNWNNTFGSVSLKGNNSHFILPLLAHDKVVYSPTIMNIGTFDNRGSNIEGYINKAHIWSSVPLPLGTNIKIYVVRV